MCHKLKKTGVISVVLALMLLLTPLSAFAAEPTADSVSAAITGTGSGAPVTAAQDQAAANPSATRTSDATVIGQLTGAAMVPADEIASASAVFHQPTKLAAFINEVQTWFSGANISATNPSGAARHPQGGISRDSLAAICDNVTDTLYKIDMSGWQLKIWMEWAAAQYGRFDPATDLTVTYDQPTAPDQFSGLEYTIDLTKAEGDRVSIGAVTGGGSSVPFASDTRYTVALSSDRANNAIFAADVVFTAAQLSAADRPVLLQTDCNNELPIGTDIVSLMAYYVETVKNGIIQGSEYEKNWSLIHLNRDARTWSQAVYLINGGKIPYTNSAAVTKADLEPYDFVDIFSFNDFHGTLDNTVSTSNPGAAKFVAYAKSQRQSSRGESMILAGGDNYQGSAMSNLLLGEPVSKMMELLEVSYSAIGNHEFDWGADRIPQWESQGITRFLCANIFNRGTTQLADFCTPAAVETLPNGIKVGLIGLATPSTVDVVKADYVNPYDFSSQYEDIVNPLITDLKTNQGCDLVIALTHLGAGGNGTNVSGEVTQLVNQCPTLDGVITGHTHSTVAGSVSGSTVPVVQAAYNGRRLGKLSYVLENGAIMEMDGVKQATASTTAVPTAATAPVDDEMTAIYSSFADALAPMLNTEVGHFNRLIDSRAVSADWATQLVYDYIKKETGTSYVLVQNSGGWRDTGVSGTQPKLAADPVNRSYLYTLMPFDNEIVLMDMKGSDLLADVLNYQGPPNRGSSPNYAGVYKDGNDWYLTETHEKVDPETTYKVACNDFMFVPGANGLGGDNYKFSNGFNHYYMGVPLRDAMEVQLGRRDSLSGDIGFETLTAEEGEIRWNETASRYEITVGHTVTALTLHATLAGGATFTVSGNRGLSLGENTMSLQVVAPNGATFTYELVVTSLVRDDQPQPAAFDLVTTPQGELNYLVEIPVAAAGLTAAEYSFDGTSWSGIRVKTADPGETVVGYVRYKADGQYNASPARSASVALPLFKVKTPAASPNGGEFEDVLNVYLTTGTWGAEIFYTTNGDTPTAATGQLYGGPVNLKETTTIKAIAVKNGMTTSDVFSVVFTKKAAVVTPKAAAPTATPVGGTFKDSVTVTLSTETAGAEIYYTTNGNAPTAAYGTRYTGPLVLKQTTTLKAIAVKSGMTDSDIFTATWSKQTVTETATKPARYSVSFAAVGGAFKDGKAARTLRIIKGNALGLHYAPVRKGYEFLGWYTKKTGGTRVPVSQTINKTTTLYAHWVRLGKVNTGSLKLNLRAKAWGRIIGQYVSGTKVRVYSRTGDWYKVEAGDKAGYMHRDYIRLASLK